MKPWQTDGIVQCVLGSMALDVQRLGGDDSYDNDILAYPFENGADIDAMGRRPRRITVQHRFTGSDVVTRFEEYLQLLDQSTKGPPLIFIHPYRGQMDVRVEASTENANHDQRLILCSLTLLVHGRESIELPRASIVDVEASVTATLDAIDSSGLVVDTEAITAIPQTTSAWATAPPDTILAEQSLIDTELAAVAEEIERQSPVGVSDADVEMTLLRDRLRQSAVEIAIDSGLSVLDIQVPTTAYDLAMSLVGVGGDGVEALARKIVTLNNNADPLALSGPVRIPA